jgi:hypothetical protein
MTVSLRLQEALVAAVRGAGLDVYDGPPAEAVLPYVTVGADVVTDISTKTHARRQHRYTLAIWMAGDAVAAVKPVMASVETAVLAMPATLGDGWHLVTNDFVQSTTRSDPARGLVSARIEFRARTERAF